MAMDPLARRLVLTAKSMRAHFEAVLDAEGAALTFWLVLRELAQQDNVSQRQLAQRLSVEAPTLTRHLDRMVAEGLVTRTRDDVDRRITRIALTATGRRMHERLLGVANALSAEFDSLLTPREHAVMDKALAKINDYLEVRADAG